MCELLGFDLPQSTGSKQHMQLRMGMAAVRCSCTCARARVVDDRMVIQASALSNNRRVFLRFGREEQSMTNRACG